MNDTAKLMMHRLIARRLSHDPSLIERAKVSLGRSADRFGNYTFVHDWNELLELPVSEIRHRLTCRDEKMTRLRLSSPFVLAEGVDFEDEALRRRIWRAAKRIAVRSTEDDRTRGLRMTA
ncbi:hypothetical protein [Pseudorhodoplanes sp.]|uniref:hypothetical protein n=1 Tax=Pseudorhodoplanes sp. TaxID=1934341 RepID=UPI002C132142|nr:hypothetical protein [Pseudorhodoplanes sp.]HWV51734.1 hypothetical protein [Pseudorhodoplanes sp.]